MQDHEPSGEPQRCVILVDESLPAGKAANAAAVIALTLGKRHPYLCGEDLADASGILHPGLIPIGIAILAAEASRLSVLRAKARDRGLDVVDFPVQGQMTNDYAEFGSMVAGTAPDDLRYAGIGLYGPRKAVTKVTGHVPLLK